MNNIRCLIKNWSQHLTETTPAMKGQWMNMWTIYEHVADKKTFAKNVHLGSILIIVQFGNLLSGILKKLFYFRLTGTLSQGIKTFLTNLYQTFITYLNMLVIWLTGSHLENSVIHTFSKNLPLKLIFCIIGIRFKSARLFSITIYH